MKHHIAIKFIAILLCAAALLATGGSAIGVIFLAQTDLYDQDVNAILQEERTTQLNKVASELAADCASTTLGGMREEAYYQYNGGPYYHYVLEYDKWYYTITDAKGNILESTYDGRHTQNTLAVTEFYYEYYTLLDTRNLTEESESNHSTGVTTPVTAETVPPEEVVESESPTEVPITEEMVDASFWYETYDYETGADMAYLLYPQQIPGWTVTLYYDDDAFLHDVLWELVRLVWALRYTLFWVFGGGLLLFAILAVYLCCSAGRKPGSNEIKPAAFNCLPLDGYAFLVGGGCFLLAGLVAGWLIPWIANNTELELVAILGIGLCAYTACLLVVVFCYACAAQFKAGNGYWWRHSITGLVLLWSVRAVKWTFQTLLRILRWLAAHVPPAAKASALCLYSGGKKICGSLAVLLTRLFAWVKKLIFRLWAVTVRLFKSALHTLERFFSLLPLTWQWLLTGSIMVVVICLSLRTVRTGWILLCLGSAFAVILYGTQAFGILLESADRMRKGDLETKVSDQLLIGSFKDFAGHLNALADVVEDAAKNQLKSERMKTELITNVSHDIKTPLTSIINFVDLLEKPHTPEEEAQYLDVLHRQSQRLKKLIEDLMEMSKASTGNLAVEITQVDAIEAMNQALGEFTDKLAAAQLSPVFHPGEGAIPMAADGRLVWRVLSNLLSNAVKYALPGTRLYVDVIRLEDKVLLSLKNISKEQLNISSDELMERFVRGDASRNTEGSGLGLNIAKSLMELQGGELQLLVDGDLFKATLVFPAA